MSNLEPINFSSIIADFSADVELTPALAESRRNRICELEAAIRNTPNNIPPEVANDGNLEHFFAGGVYGRKLFIPAGQAVVSKIHRAKTLNILLEGAASVISERGYHLYQAPHVFVSDPFTKRVVITHEDTVWLTAHGTYQTELDKVEDEIIAKDFTELNQLKESL